MFKVLATGKRKKKQWKRMVTKVSSGGKHGGLCYRRRRLAYGQAGRCREAVCLESC